MSKNPEILNTHLKAYLIVCFVALFLTVFSFGYVLIKNFHYIDQRTAQISQTMKAVENIQTLRISFKSAESSIRFTVLRDRTEYLEDYYKGLDYPRLIENIRADVAADNNDDASFQKINELKIIIDKRFDMFDNVVKLWRAGRRKAIDEYIASNPNVGLELVVKTEDMFKNLLNDETVKQTYRVELFHDAERFTIQLSLGLIIILITLFAFMAFVIWRLVEKEERQKYFTRWTNELENQVADRTHDLIESNKEMETFSYSVSHDLRAPLRAIEGFSNILVEDFSEKLGEDGLKKITVIITNVRQMGQLIDDILNFSRMGRKDLAKINTNLNRIADAAIDEVKKSPYFKDVDTIHVHDLGYATVDASIFKQVFTNLIGNAVKFSSHAEKSDIVVGVLGTNPQTYFVRDNGVGFDMKHANKLFNVFSRLHKRSDFEGTGVGLAIVKKIITKHGGRVWVESSPNSGATFYFCLS